MAIELIPNQPFIFNQAADDTCNNSDQRRYCQLVADGDPVRILFKQSPCGDNVLCNPQFNVFEDELVTNGDFSGGSTGWTLSGTPAPTIVAAKCVFTGGTGRLTQNLVTVVTGRLYKVVFQISGTTTGSIQATIGGGLGAVVSADGTYTQFFRCGGINTFLSFFVTGDNTFDGAIDNISVKEWECWDIDNEEVIVSNSGVCHLAGTETTISQSGVLTADTLYQAVISISNCTTGSVTLNNGQIFTANGFHITYYDVSVTDVSFVMSSDFNGCVNSLFIYPLINNFSIDLLDLDGNLIANLDTQGEVTYQSGYVATNIFLTQGTLLDTDGNPVPYGCYKIAITDPCTDELVCDSSFDGETCLYQAWRLTANATIGFGVLDISYDVAVHKGLAQQSVDILAHTCYTLCYDIDTITVSDLVIEIGEFTKVLSPGFKGVGCIKFFLENPADEISISQISSLGSEAIVNSVSIKVCENYVSNCLTWQETHPCSRFMYSTGSSMGGFSPVFSLSIRLRILAITPLYPQEEDDYLFSSGIRAITYAQSEKYWTMLFDYVDEISHDCIRTLIMCSEIFISNNTVFGSTETEFYFKKGQYQPEWDKDGRLKLAQSRVEAKQKDQTVFNTNCS